ncbi:penicillin acylase family protein [Flavobacteriaceae bacterium TP-CH-4]|uniref:Penicillin acylase family protein n=1 Tax=Pelagihabitans pacificus TaxID=2696054 RepID=A0A967AWQ5_9FLAO|nr:penicillin acylase family protein [Pelagihabitans pacificus]NHF61327.1 penicillin acylase family protein [Pelagihabitans pacificus]
MKYFKRPLLLLMVALLLLNCKKEGDGTREIHLQGLQQTVEVIRDEAGINHIYAQNQHDLFFAQGYCAAKDRLFQFEIWRRQATGTVAEILGERELQRDIGTRLFKFRGDMNAEMQYYHPDGIEILTAYTDGVNAYIEEVLQHPEALPIPFKALDILPQKWTPEVIISRHQGLLGNSTEELAIGRAVAKLGVDKVKEYTWFHPKEPLLELDTAIDGRLLQAPILALYNAYRKPLTFEPSDIVPEYRVASNEQQEVGTTWETREMEKDQIFLGSNNWVTAPSRSENGHAYMANDPHRRLAIPSLRYWVHLSAPGWNVIGGGEPEIPGVSIGHNEYGAWGLTVFETDGEDLYVYDLNPDNLLEYNYQGDWEAMKTLQEVVKVKNQGDETVTLRYTRHGPVTYIDSVNHKAYAVRCAWMEPGGAPYLASLRMDQAKSWEEFREACNYSHIPGENMIWADTEGNIGWQAVGIAPIRRNFSGLVPVPGDGRYEWDGYLPIVQKPSSFNPSEGFIATANQNVTPDEYTEWDAIGYTWADPYRGMRIDEVLGSNKKLSIEDMKALQTDYHSIPARTLVPLLLSLDFEDATVANARNQLVDWDHRLHKNSVAAGIYVAWEKELVNRLLEYVPDPGAEELLDNLQMARLMQWLLQPNLKFGSAAKRDAYLAGTFESAVLGLSQRLGENIASWKYGQAAYKHVQIKHPLGEVVNSELQAKLNTELKPRGGNQHTPGSTGSADSQLYGATFKIIADVNDWDRTIGTNPPGQSGDPESPFYKNLYDGWAEEEYVPIYFSRSKIDSVAQNRQILVPKEP